MTKPKPIKVGLKTGEKFVLEYSREAAETAEDMGFDITCYEKRIANSTPILWHCAFLKNHPGITVTDTDAIMEELGGVHVSVMARLAELYSFTINTLIRESGEAGNEKVTVAM